MLFGHWYVFFGEMSVLIFCPFSDLGVFRVFDIELHELLYIVEVNPLSVACLKISSPILRLYFCLFSLLCKSFLSLNSSHLFIFIFITLEGESKKIFL